ncbi:MAG: NAD(P)-dependent oxidoreductase [Roseburia sp.]|nr:NAD(P)-dependent oxidoreductase [Roseburia sp.]
MNILIIGGAGTFTRHLIDRLDKEGHRIFVLTGDPKGEHKYRKVFETYYFAYDNVCIKDVMKSIRPDVVLFMGAYDRGFLWKEEEETAVSYTSGLTNLLMAFGALERGRFVYLSSEIVFQRQYPQEIEEGEPYAAYTRRAEAVAMGERLCLDYAEISNADTVVLRLDHMYEIPENTREAESLCARMCIEALETGEIVVQPELQVALLYVSDAVEFVYRIMVAKEHQKKLYQVSARDCLSQPVIAKLIRKELGKDINIVEDPEKQIIGNTLSDRSYDEEFGIRIIHRPETVLPQLARHIKRHASVFCRVERRQTGLLERWRRMSKGLLPILLPFLENLICFIPFFMLNNRAVGSEYFQNLDFYLLYVLLFAIVHGQQQATFSCLLAVAGYSFRQMYQRSGFDVMLDYNTYVWIAQLLILGLVIGYMRDQLRANKEEQLHEVDYLTKQIDDIAEINVSNVKVKEILSDQIINQNDSFGKLYEITSSLDQYEPEEVLFYAAEVLSRLMGSKDVAIYTVANRSFARLFSFTSQKAHCLGNSINYVEMTDIYDRLKEKKVYINKNMDERYPLMANAIYSEDEMQLILMVWGIPWERMTLGQANMLTVIGYLIQNAVLRANRYMLALERERYIENTRILEEEAFRSLVRAYMNARQKELTECALILVEQGELSQKEISDQLSGMMRQSDYLGRMEDEGIYALLANTNSKAAEMVCMRFREAGFACQIQEDIMV